MRYLRIAAECAAAAADATLDAFAEAGLAVEVCDQTTLEKPAPGRVRFVTYAEPGGSEEQAVRRLLEGAAIDALVSVSEQDDSAWRDRWKEYFRPRRIGRFVIAPSWEPYAATADEIVVNMDPGRAFGTGGHASTRLCLLGLGDVAACARFLDVGCGSGVLAIAAARRFPGASGMAIDVLPEAIEVTRENAEKNGVGARISASTAALATIEERFDLVLANLQLELIDQLAEALAARLAPEGRLLVSGILVSEGDTVAARLAAAGLRVVSSSDEEEWRSLVVAATW